MIIVSFVRKASFADRPAGRTGKGSRRPRGLFASLLGRQREAAAKLAGREGFGPFTSRILRLVDWRRRA